MCWPGATAAAAVGVVMVMVAARGSNNAGGSSSGGGTAFGCCSGVACARLAARGQALLQLLVERHLDECDWLVAAPGLLLAVPECIVIE